LQKRNEIYTLVKQGISHANSSIKLSAIEAMGAFIDVNEPKETKIFEDLLAPTLETIYSLIKTEESIGQNALEVICDLVDVEPKFFKKNFNFFFIFFVKLSEEKSIEHGIKRMILEAMVTIVERIPSLVKN